MSKVSCHRCGRTDDARAMQVCEHCRNYVCTDCLPDHPGDCEQETALF